MATSYSAAPAPTTLPQGWAYAPSAPKGQIAVTKDGLTLFFDPAGFEVWWKGLRDSNRKARKAKREASKPTYTPLPPCGGNYLYPDLTGLENLSLDEARALVEWARKKGYDMGVKPPSVEVKRKPTPYLSPLRWLALKAGLPSKVREIDSLISPEEWATKQLSKESMTKLGLKGSPKLSKILLGLGVPKKDIDLSLTISTKETSRLEWTDPRWALEQGDSVHYRSCQKTLTFGFSDLNQTDEDLKAMQEGLLGFWTIGNPMSVDGEGFKARAKARILTKDGVPAGLYIDRPYGQYGLLVSAIGELTALWAEKCAKEGWGNLPILRPSSWDHNTLEVVVKPNLEGYSCPSQIYGYQDTLFGVTSLIPLKEGIWVEKPKGVSFKKGLYNSQSGTLSWPVLETKQPRHPALKWVFSKLPYEGKPFVPFPIYDGNLGGEWGDWSIYIKDRHVKAVKETGLSVRITPKELRVVRKGRSDKNWAVPCNYYDEFGGEFGMVPTKIVTHNGNGWAEPCSIPYFGD